MSGAEEVTFLLKVMLNKDETKVLFVEAGSDFVDVLLSFLTMPLGKIVRLFQNHYGDEAPAFGSLTSLYRGLQNLDSVHFWSERFKKMLVNPRNASEDVCHKLKLNVDDEVTKYFFCADCSYISAFEVVAMLYAPHRCGACGKENFVELSLALSELQPDYNGVFTKGSAAYIIYDDLRIVPNSIGHWDCFSSTGITEMDGAKLRKMSFGFNEIMDLLKGSLLSTTPLSDIILKDRSSAVAKPESQILSGPFVDKLVPKSKTMTLKMMVQKSTNKVLFAQAEEDLVDFLFSFLAIPLGGVASLLQGNTSLTNIDNLYKDMANSIPDKYLKTPDMKNRLIKPKLALHYLSSNQILPLDEETHPPLYYHCGADGKKYLSTSNHPSGSIVCCIESPRDETNYVKGPTTYMITDDLVITQFDIASSFSIINGLSIPMSDVQQLNFLIGVPEGLRILKASLTSDSALTVALLKPMMKKERCKDIDNDIDPTLVLAICSSLLLLVIAFILPYVIQ